MTTVHDKFLYLSDITRMFFDNQWKSIKYLNLMKGPGVSSQANLPFSSVRTGPVCIMSVTMTDIILHSPIKILSTEPARQSAPLSLVQRHRDTVLSLVD